MEMSENRRRMACGELYYAFTPELTAARARAGHACEQYNKASKAPRRKLIELFREYVGCSQTCVPVISQCTLSILEDKTPLPPQASTAEEDDKLFEDDPWVMPPIGE
jgi:hypothetical protein